MVSHSSMTIPVPSFATLKNRFTWEVGAYRPDLTPRTVSCFRIWRKHSFGNRVSSDSDMITGAENWINGQKCNFYKSGLNKFVLHSDKCLNRSDNYMEKWSASILLNFFLYFLSIFNIYIFKYHCNFLSILVFVFN